MDERSGYQVYLGLAEGARHERVSRALPDLFPGAYLNQPPLLQDPDPIPEREGFPIVV